LAAGADHHPPRVAEEVIWPVRLFTTNAEVIRIATGLLDHSLPRAEWTHEAHLAAVTALILAWPEIVPEQDMRTIISSYNVAVGGTNDDTQGYHETLTQFWIRQARAFLVSNPDGGLVERVNALIASPAGRRDAPFRHYSRDHLFSVAARRNAVEPDRP
jgi:hypothetical protein